MPVNELSDIEHLGNKYRLFDDTVFGPHNSANSIYRFINLGEPRPEGPYVDSNCVTEVLLAADSFKKAVDEFHHTYRVQLGAEHTVEFIGTDLRDRTDDPHLICK
jgi:hypothetical protein